MKQPRSTLRQCSRCGENKDHVHAPIREELRHMYPRLCGDCLVPAIREMQQEEGKRAEETTRDTNPL